ncbi:O-antigen polymerase [Bacteroides fluxus]|uniref:Conserved domain protein n=1 Tax=Bacteroides fluxus YIT 12057 TaxID=763034 RepID=F3PUJ6_9BACE|nr:O-antigen polymerase [Bacteroides fluxus]EGF56067.1 conserved domain protein [Bacteroides fluxus YIT 12057]
MKVAYNQLSISIITIVVILSLFWCPTSFSFNYNFFLFISFLFSSIIYFRNKKIKNFLDFEPFFVFITFLMVYIFPLFVFDDQTAFLFSFNQYYDLTTINKGVALSTIAILCFFIGNLVEKKQPHIRNSLQRVRVSNGIVITASLVLYIVFYLLGGFDNFLKVYKGESGGSSVANYVLVLLQVLCPIMCFNEFWNKSNVAGYHYNWIAFLLVLWISLHFAIVGSRTNASIILLSSIVAYSVLIKNQSICRFLVFMIVGIMLMWILQSFRAGYDTNWNLEWYYMISDLFIPNTNTYLSIEIVNKQGITYGVSSLASILSVIPFLQGYVESVFSIGPHQTNSATLFTDYLGSSAGMGTNFIADLYLSFGILGVIIFPFLFGYILCIIKSHLKVSYYSSLLYIIIAGFSVYIVRSSLFFLLKFLLFGFLLAYFFNYLSTKKRKLC